MIYTAKISLLLVAMTVAISDGYTQRHQYNFAQSYIGLQGDYLSSTSTAPSFGAARMMIGGTHFWYHADFYISFPLTTFPLQQSAWQYSEGVTTGGRYLPFGPGEKWPMPFIGMMWLTPRTRIGDGPEVQRSRLGLDAGLSLVAKKKHTLEVRLQYQHNASMNYPSSREAMTAITPPQWTFGVAFKKYFDFTAGNARPGFKNWEEAAVETFEARGGLSGWSVGAGVSANVVLGSNPFAESIPFLPTTVPLATGPDVSIGYYHHKADAYLRGSYRTFSIGQEAYGYVWQLREHRLAAEGLKFLFDYKGFVPFVGPMLGATAQRYATSDGGETLADAAQWVGTAGIVFGWDIRPSRVEWLILRTNLRWVKTLQQENKDSPLPSSHLEVNFIQVVIYPKRLSNLKYVQP